MSKQEKFGSYIKRKRIEKNFTQAELAKKLGVAQNYITYIEQERRVPSPELLKKLSKNIEVSLEELYCRINPELEKIIYSNTPDQELNPSLSQLKKNKKLCQLHSITDDEINMLASIRARGQVHTAEEYILLLLLIRQIFRD